MNGSAETPPRALTPGSPQPVSDLPEKLDRGFAVRKLAAACAKPHRDHVIGSKPRRHALELDETLISNPAPVSISENATSETTRRLRNRRRELPRPPSPWVFFPSLESGMEIGLAARTAGARPKTIPVRIDTANVNARTDRSMPSTSSRGMAGIDRPDDIEARQRDQQSDRAAHQAEQHARGAAVAPGAARPRRARADRYFFWRLVARVSSRLATFAQAISSTSVTEPKTRAPRGIVADDLLEQRNDADGNVRSRLSLSRIPAAITLTSACASAIVTPGLARHDVVVLVSPSSHGIGAERQRKEDVHPPRCSRPSA